MRQINGKEMWLFLVIFTRKSHELVNLPEKSGKLKS